MAKLVHRAFKEFLKSFLILSSGLISRPLRIKSFPLEIDSTLVLLKLIRVYKRSGLFRMTLMIREMEFSAMILCSS